MNSHSDHDVGGLRWGVEPICTWPDSCSGLIKDVPFGSSTLTAVVGQSGLTSGNVVLHSSGDTSLAHLPSPAPGMRFSDNYLDIPDGGEVRIEVSGLPVGFDPREITVRGYSGQRVEVSTVLSSARPGAE